MEDPEILQPLESMIRQQFIPALTGKDSPGDLMRKLLALPAKLGGLSISNPVTISAEQHSTSKLISAPLWNEYLNKTTNWDIAMVSNSKQRQ